jgi:hypothetical protein
MRRAPRRAEPTLASALDMTGAATVSSSVLQRVCACGQHSLAGGACEACRDGPRRSYDRPAASRPTDELEAVGSADARVWWPDSLAPGLGDGVQAAHAPPLALSRQPLGIQRAPLPGAPAVTPAAAPAVTPASAPAASPATTPASAPASGAKTREAFERTMRRRWGVRSVVTGTQPRQTTEATPGGGAPPGGIVLPNWQSWDPGAASDSYDQILDAFEDFAAAIGGAPAVSEIVFYNVHYDVSGATGIGTPDPNVGATYAGGHLTLYRAATTGGKWLPAARSTAAGPYPNVGLAVTKVRGQSPGAPIPYAPDAQSTRRNIAHELGHGLGEAALAHDPGAFRDFRMAVGWTEGSPELLYDVQAPGVASALASTPPSTPPASALITINDWNSPAHGEQPLTAYAVEGGAGEDFAESVMALVYEPALLRARSPVRHAFLTQRLASWLSRLVQSPPIGDFPEPSERVRGTA